MSVPRVRMQAQTFDKYLQRMAAAGTWGDNLSLQVSLVLLLQYV